MSNFARWPTWAAGLLLAFVAALVVDSALPSAPPPVNPNHYSDIQLYRNIVDRVSHGEDYYVVTADEQRAHGYPTAPSAVIREPTEAWFLAALQTDQFRQAALLSLTAAAIVAMWFALAQMGLGLRTRVAAVGMILSDLTICLTQYSAYIHECWAGLLLLLSLALRRPDRWALSVCAGLAACLFRELALPFLVVMFAFAVRERRVRESLAWAGAIAVFLALIAVHWTLAAAQHQPTDPANAGWLKFGGLGFVVATLRWNEVLVAAPAWLLTAILCASALGLAGRGGAMASRAALTLVGYAGAFAIIGRPENGYWGILYASLIPLGLALSPPALRDLALRALARPTSSAVVQPAVA